jgi:hypothetical protein
VSGCPLLNCLVSCAVRVIPKECMRLILPRTFVLFMFIHDAVRISDYMHYDEGVWGSGCIDHIFLTSAQVGGEWSASRPGRFAPGEGAPGIHWIGPQSRSGRRGENI